MKDTYEPEIIQIADVQSSGIWAMLTLFVFIVSTDYVCLWKYIQYRTFQVHCVPTTLKSDAMPMLNIKQQ